MPVKRRDGEIILDFLEDVGFKWIGKEADICSETPSEKLNRFKLYNSSLMVLAISLWYGTSLSIPCDDWAIPDDIEIGLYRKDFDNNELSITVMIRVKKNKQSSSIEKIYHVFITDKMSVLPPKYTNYRVVLETLEEVKGFLEMIRNSLTVPNHLFPNAN